MRLSRAYPSNAFYASFHHSIQIKLMECSSSEKLWPVGAASQAAASSWRFYELLAQRAPIHLPPLYLSLFNLRISFYAPSLRSELKTRIIRWNRYSEYVRIFTFAVGANILSLVGWVNLMERIGVVLGPKRRPEQVSDLLPRFPEWVGPGIFQVGLFTFVLKPTASSSSLQWVILTNSCSNLFSSYFL